MRRRWLSWAWLAAAVLAGCAPAPVRVDAAPARVITRAESRGSVDESGRVVRVALGVDVATARLAAAGEWRLSDESGRTVLARVTDGAEWRVERRGDSLRAVSARGATGWRAGPLVARPVALGALLTYNGKRYRGELWAHAGATRGSALTVVNRLAAEEYLRGVVPLELNMFAPEDAPALEAQAVAARSYTYSRLAEFQPRGAAVRQAARAFDLRSTVSDQVYGGVDAERPASDRAIRATAGLVLRYRGAVVSAPYHSTCGGMTAAPSELWGGEGGAGSSGEPYLARVSDRVPGTEDRHYCDVAPRFRWSREYDAGALDAVLRRYLAAYARRAERGGGAERLLAVAVEGRTGSGRAEALSIATDSGRFVLRGNDIRFAVRSAGGEILPSTYFSVETTREARGGDGRLARVTLRGRGNGHGVGMCQWGAVGRARAGHDFRAILGAYYPGAAVEPVE